MFSSKKLFATLLALLLTYSPIALAQVPITGAGNASTDSTSGTPISNACSTSSGTTITFTAQGIGGANPSRISVVTIAWDDSTAAGTAQLTGVTIGGISMTRAVRATSGVANSNSEIWYVANPTGTTANIVLTSASAIDGVTIEVYSLIGFDTVSATTTGTTSVTQAYDNKQLAIAVGSRTVNVSTSLSNMTNDFSSACGANLWGVHASQRLNGNNGTLTSTISPTSNNPKIALAKWTVGFVASCTASTNFIARTSGSSNAQKINYDTLICGMVTDGTFAKMDVLYTFATDTTGNAVLNLVQNSFNAVLHGSPTFTANRGYTGVDNSSTVFIDTGFNGNSAPSPHFTGAAAHISAFQANNLNTSSGAAISALQTSGSINSYIRTHTTNYFGCLNNVDTSCAQNFSGISATTVGHWLINRPNGTSANTYYNGAVTGANITSGSTIPNFNFYVIAHNIAGTAAGSNNQIAGASIGGVLTAGEITSFYNRMRTYMTAEGVP